MESDANFLPEIMHDFTRFQPVENTAEDVGWLALEVGLMRQQLKINRTVGQPWTAVFQ
jgi:hypothetical protein